MATDDKDPIDRRLESALKQYGTVEPRAGLESRILANLDAQSRLAARRSWLFATAGIVACIVLIAVWHIKNPQTVAKDVASVSSPPSEHVRQPSRANSVGAAARAPVPAGRRHARTAAHPIVAAHSPQFPTPRPLTERELALARYATSFPKEAQLIAQEQQTFDEEMQREQLELRNQAQLSDHER